MQWIQQTFCNLQQFVHVTFVDRNTLMSNRHSPRFDLQVLIINLFSFFPDPDTVKMAL